MHVLIVRSGFSQDTDKVGTPGHTTLVASCLPRACFVLAS